MKPDGTHLSLYDRRIKRVVDVLREDLESADTVLSEGSPPGEASCEPVRRGPGGHP
jgi:hypothetical protein